MSKALFIILLPITFLFAQLPQSSGNLLHVDVNDHTVTIADSAGNWENGINDLYSIYTNIIRVKDSLNLIRYEQYFHEFIQGYNSLDLENPVSGKVRNIYYDNSSDVIGLYNIPQNVYEISNGFWIFDDVLGRGFLSKADSLYPDGYLYHICGKVDSLYFVIWYENYKPAFYLLNLDDSPFIDISDAQALNFSDEDRPVQVEHFKDDLYFIQTASSVKLYTFQADSFKYVKTVLSNTDYMNIYFNENILYAFEQNKLLKHNFNSADTSFSQAELLLSGDIYVDRNYKYAVKTDSTNLILFDVVNESMLKSWDISQLGYCFKPLIDYPDIYFHHTVNVTAVAHKEPVPEEYFLAKAYPNPFNSSIVFYIKNNTDYAHINIKIFDIQGRLVKKINRAEINKIDKIVWQPRHLSSGIYYVRINNGKRNLQLKVCYLK